MNPKFRALAQICVLVGIVAVLLFLFPRAFAFAELAARELLYLWWLILLVALAVWLIWGINRKPRK
jgi:hypothetical protein